MSYTLGFERDRVAYSPRALSLGIMRNSGYADLRYTPTLRDNIAVRLASDNFSDSNRRHAVTADWRHAVYRGTQAYVDVGLQGDWLGLLRRSWQRLLQPRQLPPHRAGVSSTSRSGPERRCMSARSACSATKPSNWKRASDQRSTDAGIFSHWQSWRARRTANASTSSAVQRHSFGLQLRYRFCEFSADRCP
jgi:hypothetical protein